jgi:hypothetical protein
MKEYIERAAVLKVLEEYYPGVDERLHIVKDITSIPAADVAEVRHGRWIFEPGKIPYCSECKEYSDDGDKGATFCPWCGVRMDKEAEHE